jgi:hypothetical protein
MEGVYTQNPVARFRVPLIQQELWLWRPLYFWLDLFDNGHDRHDQTYNRQPTVVQPPVSMVIVKMERHEEEIQRVWADDGFGQPCPWYPPFPRKPPREEDGYSR